MEEEEERKHVRTRFNRCSSSRSASATAHPHFRLPPLLIPTSTGGPKHDRSHSPYYSKEHSIKISDGQWKRKGDEKDFDRDSGRSRSGKDSDSYRHAERKSYRNPDNHRTQDDYSRHRRHADDEERGYQRSSRSGRESRSGHYDHTRQDTEHDRSRENWRNSERYSRDRSDDWGHRKKDTERQTAVIECHRHNDNDLSSERPPFGRRQANSNTKEVKMGEQERHRDRGGVRDDEKDHRRSTGDHKNDNASNHEEFREHAESLTAGRDSSASRLKETYNSSSRELNAQKEDRMQKRKHDDPERDNSSSSPIEKISRNDQYQAAEKSPSSSNDVQVTVSTLAMQPVPSSANKVESSNDLDAAKVAAMKAAELVNRNIVGSGYMSTDQKKKLLWGNKKTTAAVESGSHWGGMPLFSDRERQEKFNKLMSLRLPWYLWPIVGCERRFETGAEAYRQRWQQSLPSREAGATPAGLGEAIHCWSSSKRRSHSWTWPVIVFTCYLHTLLTIVDILFCSLLRCMNHVFGDFH